MAFRKIDAPSIKELFATQMKEMILSGELQPGEQIPSERELADLMGISKTIVHEGIRDLVRMGFLTVIARKGVYVADYMTTGNLETLFAMMEFRGELPDKRIILNLLDMRIFLECPALKLLAEKRSDGDLEKLDSVLTLAREAKGDVSEFTKYLFEFHRDIAAMSGNAISPLIMNAFFTPSVRAWEHYCGFFGTDEAYKTLEELFLCMQKHDGDLACEIFEGCIYKYKNYILEQN